MLATIESDESYFDIMDVISQLPGNLLREGEERKLLSAERTISGSAFTKGGLLKGSQGNI